MKLAVLHYQKRIMFRNERPSQMLESTFGVQCYSIVELHHKSHRDVKAFRITACNFPTQIPHRGKMINNFINGGGASN